MIGVNLVVQSCSIRGGDDGVTLCVSVGSLQPLVVALKRGSGVVALSGDAACRALLTQGSSARLPLSVMVLSSCSSQNVVSVGTVNDLSVQLEADRENHRLYAPEPCLQLPSLLLATALVTVPLVRASGVATHYGTVTLALSVFDMGLRGTDCLAVLPTGRVAQRQAERRLAQQQAARALPPGLAAAVAAELQRDGGGGGGGGGGGAQEDEGGEKEKGWDGHEEGSGAGGGRLAPSLRWLDETDAARADARLAEVSAGWQGEGEEVDEEDEEEEEGAPLPHQSTDSLGLASLLDKARGSRGQSGGEQGGDGVSESTLTLDGIWAEMQQRAAEAEAEARAKAEARARAAAEAEAEAGRGKKNAAAVGAGAVAKTKAKAKVKAKGAGTAGSGAVNKAAPTRPNSTNGGTVRPTTPGQPSAKTSGKAKAKPKANPKATSRVVVLVRRDELGAAAAAAEDSAPSDGKPRPSAKAAAPTTVPASFYDLLAEAAPLDVSMLDAATAARVRERQVRAAASLPVLPPPAPLLVFRRAPVPVPAEGTDEPKPKPKPKAAAKVKAKQGPSSRQRETLLAVNMGPLS